MVYGAVVLFSHLTGFGGRFDRQVEESMDPWRGALTDLTGLVWALTHRWLCITINVGIHKGILAFRSDLLDL